MIAVSTGQSIFEAGQIGAQGIETVARRWMKATGNQLPEANMQAGFIVQSFALVWASISFNVPAETGQPLMKEQVDLLHESLPGLGFTWSREQTEAAVGQTWMRLVQIQRDGGDKLFQISSHLLEYYLGVDHKELAATLEMAVVVTDIMTRVRAILGDDHLANGRESPVLAVAPSDSVASKTVDSDDRYPLEVDEVAMLHPSALARHVTDLRMQKSPKTLAELRRREALRKEIQRCVAQRSSPIRAAVTHHSVTASIPQRKKSTSYLATGVEAILKAFAGAVGMGLVILAMLSTISLQVVIAAASFLLPLAVIAFFIRSC